MDFKYGRKCEKINFKDICKTIKGCSGYQCDKRHPMVCYSFENNKKGVNITGFVLTDMTFIMLMLRKIFLRNK